MQIYQILSFVSFLYSSFDINNIPENEVKIQLLLSKVFSCTPQFIPTSFNSHEL